MERVKKALAYPPSITNLLLEKIISTQSNPIWRCVGPLRKPDNRVQALACSNPAGTAVDDFWSTNTVYDPGIRTRLQSKMNIQWRFRTHPMFKELSGLYGDHTNEVILDYGCGPGNDIAGFLTQSNVKKIIGMDVSQKALEIAGRRAALHHPKPGQVEFIKISDAAPAIPLPDSSVDFISSQGVLMHTSEPLAVLREMRRVLKIGGSGCIMVYSRPSVWYHLYTAYEHMIINNSFPGLSLEEAFTRNTDGRDCPMSRCFITEDFVNMCQSAGFECEYIGGYLTQAEMISIKRYWRRALCDSRLSEEHKDFLRLLEFDKRGLPMIHGRYAGVSGIYQIRRDT